MCQTGSLFTCTMFTRRPGIPLQYNKRWTCACVRELCALHALPESTPHRSILWLHLQFRRWQALFGALPFCFLQAPLPWLGRVVGRETAPARERERERSPDLRRSRGNNGDAPRCDSGRQEQAQTQEPASETDLPRPENLEEELSLAPLLSFSNMPWCDKKATRLLTVCCS